MSTPPGLIFDIERVDVLPLKTIRETTSFHRNLKDVYHAPAVAMPLHPTESEKEPSSRDRKGTIRHFFGRVGTKTKEDTIDPVSGRRATIAGSGERYKQAGQKN